MNERLFTLTDKLKEMVEHSPDKIVMQIKREDGYASYTYKQVYEASYSIAGSLIGLGIKKGDRVAIILENRPEWGMVYFAILFAGGISVPIDYQSSQKEKEFILGHSESKMLFTSLNHFSLSEDIPSIERIVLLDSKEWHRHQSFRGGISKKCIDFSNMISGISQSNKALLFPVVYPDDIASILYTSGTTGRPKGAMLTHKNFSSNFQSIAQLKLLSEKDNVLSILPLHHSFPFMVTLLIPLFSQGRITYISTLKSEDLLECMRETKVTILVGVPQLLYMFYKRISGELKKVPSLIRISLSGFIEILWLVRKISKINLTRLALSKIHRAFGRSLRFFACGGAKLNKEAARFLIKVGFTILEGYGLTETSPIVSFNPAKKQKIGSVGKVIPGVKIKIVEPDEYGIGEIVIKGPNVMKGYYKEEEQTKEVLKDGWFYSGDLGYLDREGYLYITGRKKELIVLSSGKNISPEEVESHYARSHFIKELCVLAIGEREEERLVTVIVPDTDYYRKAGEVNIYGMIKWDLENLSKQIAPYKRIMGFVVTMHELPRTRLGKLKRFKIKDRYLDELKGEGLRIADEEISLSDEDLKILSSQLGKRITESLAKQGRLKRQIRLDDHLEIDLGLDSLGRVELMVLLENILKIDIPDSLMAKTFTVRELMLKIEKLILERGLRVEKALPIQGQSSLWSKVLNTSPPGNIIKKIDLFPNWMARVFTQGVCVILYIIFKLVWQLKVSGIKNLPQDGAFILCPNHSSYLDGFLIVASVPQRLRERLFSLGFRAYFEVSIIRDLVKLIRIIPIDPGEQLVDAMQACAYILKNSKSICIFPEGVRSIDGEVKEFKKGVGILAKEMKVRLVPVYISGSYESWPRTKRFPVPHPVKIAFGRAKTIKELQEQGIRLGAEDDYAAVALGIREEVIRLKAEI